MVWLQTMGIFYGLFAIVTGLVLWGMRRKEEEMEEFPFRPLRQDLADKLKSKEVPVP